MEVEIVSQGRHLTPQETWDRVKAKIAEYVDQPNLFHIPTLGPRLASQYMVKTHLPIKYTTRFIDGDGNCLFRAFSHWKTGNQEDHDKVRDEIHKYSKSRQDLIKKYIGRKAQDQDVTHWINQIGKLGEWGDSLSLQLLANHYGVILVVVSYIPPDQRGHFGEYFPDQPTEGQPIHVYFIAHLTNHFEIIDPFVDA
jgi:hypothetical protein